MGLDSHKQFFRVYHNSFTSDDVFAHAANLKFSQTARGPDPRDPGRIVTVTTTTTFQMKRGVARAMAQYFMDAHLIEDAVSSPTTFFRDRGIYRITPKGLHVLERFIFKHNMNSDFLKPVLKEEPICMKLLHLERSEDDDEIIVTEDLVYSLFRPLVGREPNMAPLQQEDQAHTEARHAKKSKGLQLFQWVNSARRSSIKRPKEVTVYPYCSQADSAIEWLREFTTVSGRDEAAEMAAHLVRFELITIVENQAQKSKSKVVVVHGAPGGLAGVQAEFHTGKKAIYRITDEGCKVARWNVDLVSQLSITSRFSLDTLIDTPSPSIYQSVLTSEGDSRNSTQLTLAGTG